MIYEKMIVRCFFLFFLIFNCNGKGDRSLPPPPGTKSIGLNMFADKKVITIADWKEFVYSQKIKNPSDSFLSLNLDTAHYFIIFKKEPSEHLPIIGKTIEEINEYCLWRSKMVNSLIYQIKPDCSKKYWKKCKTVREQKMKVNYFIPTTDEYSKNYYKDFTYLKIKSNTSFTEKIFLPFVCFAKYE
ncbi:MAG: hypothetical protein HUU48_12835 [Flavobacteriales bacterium]|nr:hypothetical protein [Flavobacteriales bacterium]NUM51988.1 hypothetical protein [Flavobacteriales bacterium]